MTYSPPDPPSMRKAHARRANASRLTPHSSTGGTPAQKWHMRDCRETLVEQWLPSRSAGLTVSASILILHLRGVPPRMDLKNQFILPFPQKPVSLSVLVVMQAEGTPTMVSRFNALYLL